MDELEENDYFGCLREDRTVIEHSLMHRDFQEGSKNAIYHNTKWMETAIEMKNYQLDKTKFTVSLLRNQKRIN